jgi:hypothetical protein
VQWGDELGLERPACVVAPAPQRLRYPVHHRYIRQPEGRLSQPERSRTAVPPQRRYWRDEPGTWVYRAMQRYLRRHVAKHSEHWVQTFMASCDPIEIAQLMRAHRGALLAFGEMLWARTLEPDVPRRRWPLRRDTTQDGQPLWGHLVLRGVHADTQSLQLSPEELLWLRYQASGAVIAAAWRRSMAIAVESARSGIADWTVDPQPDPLPEHWSVRQGPAGLHFVNFMQDRLIDSILPGSDKAARRAQLQARAHERQQDVLSTCTGPCLSWNLREGWHVTASWAAVNGVFHPHRLLGLPGERPLFWLFEGEGGFVARPQAMKLQVWAQSPKAAIHALRDCLRRHRASYDAMTAVPETDGDPVVPEKLAERDVQERADDYRGLVRETRNRSRFWQAGAALALAARTVLQVPASGATQRAVD